MAPIEWRESFATGIDAVDHEHRELIDLVNRIDTVLAGDASAGEMDAALGDLYRAISSHFALEERFMREHGYDQLAEHKGDHEVLLDDLRGLMEVQDQGAAMDADAIRAFADRVAEWFSGHFRTHDARLHGRLGSHPH